MKFVDEIKESVKVNKKRLFKEYIETKEAIFLIKKSIKTKLSEDEKSKVKQQLPDVIKVLFAIGLFMLPFGSLVLLFYIRFFPKMLPSAFREE